MPLGGLYSINQIYIHINSYAKNLIAYVMTIGIIIYGNFLKIKALLVI